MVHADFREAVGADVDVARILECTHRLGRLPGVRFALTREVERGSAHAWDVVTCMEVLEHCLEDERRRVIGVLAESVASGGLAIVSVPIEIGPSLAGKQLFRGLAGLRRLGDYQYRDRYSPSEMLRGVFGWPVARVTVERAGPNGPYRYYGGHKGFDYRDVERELAARFRIVSKRFTPIPNAGALLNSQAWFVCRPA
jgi:hypothetical protein